MPRPRGEFVICIFGLLYLMMGPSSGNAGYGVWLRCSGPRHAWNIFYFSTGRTALVTIFVLFALLALKVRKVRAIAGLLAAAMVLGIIAWMSSPYLRERTEAVQIEAQKYEKTNERTSTGERLEFWKKSVEFIRQAPVIGHGTGSIRTL
jgi:O-antigen ligase